MRLRNLSRRLLVVATVLLVWSGMTARAQISPGPLARAHEHLDSTSQCFTCHGGRLGSAGIDERCVQCHTEIGWQLEHDTGLHGRENLLNCAGCHPDHAGRDFELIEWDEGSEEAFDHGRTGWPLTGAHRDKDCAKCHRASFQTSDTVRLMDRKDPGTSLLGLQPICAGCHTDVHRGTLDQDCSSCHTDEAAWKPASGFDHAGTRYPLDGKHVEVKCDACHKPTLGDEVLFSPLAHQQCSSCHEDTHRGAFGPECSSCHSTAGFKVLKLDSFDHSKTEFPLNGKHRTVKCVSCHGPATGTYKKDNFSTCSSCHDDVHAGTARRQDAATDCAACHDERGFRPSTLTVSDHDRTEYALEGAHRKVACDGCHKKEPGSADRLGSAMIRLQPAFEACTACHDESHAGQLRQREDGGACESCHTVAAWTPSTFNAEQHDELEFVLDGAHLRAECADCHGPQREDLAALPGPSELGPAGVALTLVENRCVECHVDVHEGKFEKTCDHCHGTEAFRPSTVGTEAHASFRYDLQGAHRTVPCVACHEGLTHEPRDVHLLRAGAGAPISFAAPFETCSSCHTSPHRGQFGDRESDCAGCHDQRDFIPAPRFDHGAVFPLVGEHAGVPCMDCHIRGVADDGIEYTVYRPLDRECESCHKPGSLRRSGGH